MNFVPSALRSVGPFSVSLCVLALVAAAGCNGDIAGAAKPVVAAETPAVSPAEPATENASQPVAEKPSPVETTSDDAPPAPESPADADVVIDPATEQFVKADMEHIFPQRQPAPSLGGGRAWLNTAGPLDVKDLKGKFVILDFWTYCCINCMHILPELKKLERAYPNEIVVIGVHSAKFETEQETENIRAAILRYEIEHPVVNDADHKVWESYFVNSWPSLRLIDPEGQLVAGHSGEITFDVLDGLFKKAIPFYRKRGTLDETPLRFDMEAEKASKTPLRFPGKILADEPGNRLFITDSNHNRLVITDLQGKLIETIGSGALGADDGDYAAATFDHPQGVALAGDTLYVADTENHMLRKVDLVKKHVTTIAGVGTQGRGFWPGMDGASDIPDRFVAGPKKTALNSPWALWVHEKDLYIAMAGPHQIWKMPLSEKEIGPFAGNGREDIVDGPLLPRVPYEQGFSSFAQPSGLTSDGKWLYVADSEGSSIRAVPFDPKQQVETVIGTSYLPQGRLFAFGDIDGQGNKVRLQHALGVVYYDNMLYVADTYNHKIKIIDPKTRTCTTLAGDGKPGTSDSPPQFHEPAGIAAAAGKLYVADTNNHLIRVIDLKSDNKVSTLAIEGLTPPAPVQPKTPAKPTFKGAAKVAVAAKAIKAVDGKATVKVELQLPKGWKMNVEAPNRYYIDAEGSAGLVNREATAKYVQLGESVAPSFDVVLPVTSATGKESIKLAVEYYYCQTGAEGLCKAGSVVFTVPLNLTADAEATAVTAKHVIK